jgi:hypothetical protein
MFGETSKSRLVFLIALVVGGIGAFGQAFLLHHELIDCYPYKMMSFPPAEFYADIAKSGVYFAPIAATFCGFLFGLKRFWLAIIAPIVLSPLIFACVFKASLITREWSGVTDVGRNFDDTKSLTLAQVFFSYTFSLLIAGLIIGAACSFLLLCISKTKKLA